MSDTFKEGTMTPNEINELQIIKERDYFEEWADKLAYAIAPVEIIGEHSNVNNPYQNALEYLEGKKETP
jgi:hypothetical protein